MKRMKTKLFLTLLWLVLLAALAHDRLYSVQANRNGLLLAGRWSESSKLYCWHSSWDGKSSGSLSGYATGRLSGLVQLQ